MTAPDAIDQPFFDWSVDHYARDGVEPLLLRLQDDFDFNVNLILWGCWAANHFEEIPEALWRQAFEQSDGWAKNVTASLRHARRYLKVATDQEDEAALTLREDVKNAELTAERIEQSRLEALAKASLAKDIPADVESRARRNLILLAQLHGASSHKNFSVSLLESLINLVHGVVATPSAKSSESA